MTFAKRQKKGHHLVLKPPKRDKQFNKAMAVSNAKGIDAIFVEISLLNPNHFLACRRAKDTPFIREAWTSGEFHSDKSRIVLDNDGAVITMFIYSISFHMDFNTGLFRRPTKSWSTHQLNSIYTVASLGFIYISSMIVTKFKLKEQ